MPLISALKMIIPSLFSPASIYIVGFLSRCSGYRTGKPKILHCGVLSMPSMVSAKNGLVISDTISPMVLLDAETRLLAMELGTSISSVTFCLFSGLLLTGDCC